MKRIKALFSFVLIFVLLLQTTATAGVADVVQDMLDPTSVMADIMRDMLDEKSDLAYEEQLLSEGLSLELLELLQRSDYENFTYDELEIVLNYWGMYDIPEDYEEPETLSNFAADEAAAAVARLQAETENVYHYIKTETYRVAEIDIIHICENAKTLTGLTDDDFKVFEKFTGLSGDILRDMLPQLTDAETNLTQSVFLVKESQNLPFTADELKTLNRVFGSHPARDVQIRIFMDFVQKLSIVETGIGLAETPSTELPSDRLLSEHETGRVITSEISAEFAGLTELKVLLLEGYEARFIQAAYYVSLSTGIDMRKLIISASDEAGDFIAKYDADDRQILDTFLVLYPVKAAVVEEYITENKMAVSLYFNDVVSASINAVSRANADTLSSEESSSTQSTQSAAATSGEVTQPSYRKNIEAPFSLGVGGRDSVDLNTGAMNYRYDLFTLPGRNGLDVSLSLMYNSNDSALYKESLEYSPNTAVTYNYSVRYGIRRYCSDDGYNASSSTMDIKFFTDYWAAEAFRKDSIYPQKIVDEYGDTTVYEEGWANNVESGPHYMYKVIYYTSNYYTINYDTIDYYGQPRYLDYGYSESAAYYFYDYVAASNFQSEKTYEGRLCWDYGTPTYQCGWATITPQDMTIDEADATTALPDRGLGVGWSWNLPSIEFTDGIGVLNLGNGSKYTMEEVPKWPIPYNTETTIGYTLQNYTLQDISLSGIRYYGYMQTYTLIYKNGDKLIFNGSGDLTSQSDRYGNTISYQYSNGIITTITDTVGRKITISYTSTAVTVTLPGNASYTITLDNISNHSGKQILKKITGPEGDTTFSYTIKPAKFSLLQKSGGINNYYAIIDEVFYPTQAKSEFKYTDEPLPRNLSKFGYANMFALTERKDVDVDDKTYNKTTYSYQGNHTGYGIYLSVDSCPSTYTYSTNVTESSGLSTKYTFNKCHLNTVIDNGWLRKITMEYDSNRMPTKRTIVQYDSSSPSSEYNEITESYKYNVFGDLLNYWDPGLNITTFVYDVPDPYNISYRLLLTKGYYQKSGTYITEENTLTSDRKSVITSLVCENGVQNEKARIDYGYDSHGNITLTKKYTNTTNSVTTYYVYGAIGTTPSYSDLYVTRIYTTGVVDADNFSVTAQGGNSAGEVGSSYTYDLRGNMLTSTDGNGNTTKYEYDNKNRLRKITNPDLSSQSYVYNDKANTVVHTNEKGLVLTYKYDGIGNLASITDTTGTSSPSNGQKLSEYGYDSSCRLIYESNINDSADGARISYAYDALGRLKDKTVKNKANNKTLAQEKYVYNITYSGFRTEKTVVGDVGTNPSIVTTEYTNKMGFVVQTGVIYGNTEKPTSYSYDYVGNVLSEKDRLNNKTYWEYDYAGRVTKTIYADGTYSTNEYDMLGRLTSTTDPNRNTTTYKYDSLGRLVSETLPFESGVSTTNKYYYDNNGNVTKELRQNNAVGAGTATYSRTDYNYNNRNWLEKVISYTGTIKAATGGSAYSSVAYEYDRVGNMTKMYMGIPGNGAVTTATSTTTNEYDRLGRLTKITDALGRSETNEYDTNGTLVKKTDRNGVVTTNTYDGLGRLLKSQNSVDGAANAHEYTYGMTGALLSEKNAGGTISYVYDGMGRVTSVTEPNSVTKTYTYDLNSNILTSVVKAGSSVVQSVERTYDTMNRMKTTTENGVKVAEYGYDDNGNRTSLTYNNGTAETYKYNLANMVKTLTNKLGTEPNASVLSSYSYEYNVDGNQSTKTDNTGRMTTYTYDGLGRLSEESESGGVKKTYTYDLRNNRTKLTVTGTESYTVDYVYDRNNRLEKETKKIGISTETTSYTYDNNGNQLTKLTESTSTTVNGTGGVNLLGDMVEICTYDGFNRLVTQFADSHNMKYSYRPDGLRSSKTVDGAKTDFIWSGSMMVAEVKGGSVTGYVYGINLIKSGSTYYLYNAHGDVVQLTNANGTVTKAYDYDAFGVERNIVTGDTNPFRYSGEYLDLETKTYYLRARYYNPKTGRFTQQDGWEYMDSSDPLSLNLYTYCANNPILYIDPRGTDYWIFYEKEFEKGSGYLQGALSKLYNVSKNEIHLVEAKTIGVFEKGWNDMGSGGVTIDGVFIYLHGTPESIQMGDENSYDVNWLSTYSTLKNKTMDFLILFSCNAGHLDYKDTNIASYFAQKVKGAPVFANDGTTHVEAKKSWFFGTKYSVTAKAASDQSAFQKFRDAVNPGSTRKNEGWHIYQYDGAEVSISDSYGKSLSLKKLVDTAKKAGKK